MVRRIFFQPASNFNLSPQGDGNGLSTIAAQTITISTYPRKGTETSDIFISLLHPCLFQLIPARGRKPFIIDNSFLDIHISTYPRKGTKNSASKKMRSFSFACLNFSVSVGFFSMNRAAAAFSLPWLSYYDKMCYNRAKSKHLSQNTQTHFLFIVQFFHNL